METLTQDLILYQHEDVTWFENAIPTLKVPHSFNLL